MRIGLLVVILFFCDDAYGSSVTSSGDENGQLYVGNQFPVPKIVNGDNAPEGKYKSQAMIFRDDYFICGGTILDATHILTAAHCVVGTSRRKKYDIAVGKHYMDRDSGHDQWLRVDSLVFHEDYVARTSENDIAVITLRDSVEFNDYVKPVNLSDGQRAGKKCFATGFGLVNQEPNEIANILQELRTNVISNRKCIRKAMPYGVEDLITDQVICTKDKKSGVCSGDSGGPVGCILDDVYVQFGVLSFGSTKCDRGFNVFTKVSEYRDWISQQML